MCACLLSASSCKTSCSEDITGVYLAEHFVVLSIGMLSEEASRKIPQVSLYFVL